MKLNFKIPFTNLELQIEVNYQSPIDSSWSIIVVQLRNKIKGSCKYYLVYRKDRNKEDSAITFMGYVLKDWDFIKNRNIK